MTKASMKAVRGRLSDGTPNPVDIYVGKRLHLRRTILGMSQERLAEELGITFQQVQKYEKGFNRIGASRLWDLAQVLGVGIDYFYQDLDANSQNQSPRKINSRFELSESETTFNMDAWLRKDVIQLVNAYIKINDEKAAKSILNLALSLSPKEETTL